MRSAAAGRTASEPAAAGTELGPGLTRVVRIDAAPRLLRAVLALVLLLGEDEVLFVGVLPSRRVVVDALRSLRDGPASQLIENRAAER